MKWLNNYTSIDEDFTQIETQKAIYDALPKSGKESQLWSTFLEQWDDWLASLRQIIAKCHNKDDLILNGASSGSYDIYQIESDISKISSTAMEYLQQQTIP